MHRQRIEQLVREDHARAGQIQIAAEGNDSAGAEGMADAGEDAPGGFNPLGWSCLLTRR